VIASRDQSRNPTSEKGACAGDVTAFPVSDNQCRWEGVGLEL